MLALIDLLPPYHPFLFCTRKRLSWHRNRHISGVSRNTTNNMKQKLKHFLQQIKARNWMKRGNWWKPTSDVTRSSSHWASRVARLCSSTSCPLSLPSSITWHPSLSQVRWDLVGQVAVSQGLGLTEALEDLHLWIEPSDSNPAPTGHCCLPSRQAASAVTSRPPTSPNHSNLR